MCRFCYFHVILIYILIFQERTRRQLLEELVHDQACKEVIQPLKFPRNPFQRFLPLR